MKLLWGLYDLHKSHFFWRKLSSIKIPSMEWLISVTATRDRKIVWKQGPSQIYQALQNIDHF